MERTGIFIHNTHGKCGMIFLIQFCKEKNIKRVNEQITQNFILH